MDGTSIILENFPVIRQCAHSPHNPLMQIGKDMRNTVSSCICKRWSEILRGVEVVKITINTGLKSVYVEVFSPRRKESNLVRSPRHDPNVRFFSHFLFPFHYTIRDGGFVTRPAERERGSVESVSSQKICHA